MATYYSYSEVNPYTDGAFAFSVTDEYGCEADESYLTDPHIIFSDYAKIVNDNEYNYTGGTVGFVPNTPCGFYIARNAAADAYPCVLQGSGDLYIYDSDSNQINLPAADGYRYDSITTLTCSLSTNLPIFLTDTELNTYVNMADDSLRRAYLRDHALNFTTGEVSPDGDMFELKVAWTSGTWLNDTQPTVSSVYYQCVRGKITSGKFALYKIPGIDDNKLKYGIKSSATFYELEYSTDGQTWSNTAVFPFEFIYRKRENELGTFGYALYLNNDKIPIWNSASDAQDYLDGNKDINEASNWADISSNWPYISTTEDGETSTTMGEAGNRGIFSQFYVVPLATLYELANGLYDTDPNGMWEDIKKGLEMYGQNPIDAVANLAFYPLDMASILPGFNQNYIHFGGYKFDVTNGAYKVANPNGYKTLGTMTINRSFKSWRDFEPFTKLFVYLPYIGTFQLELSRYYGKATEIRYYFDITTNTVLCALLVDNKLTDYFTGQMGVTMPITMSNFAQYAQTQIQTLLGGIGGGISGGANMAGSVKNAIAGGAASTAAAASLGVGAGVFADITIAKTAYGLAQNNINNFNKTKGGSTSMLNEFLPQYPYFIFEVQEDCAPSNYGELFGYPSMKSGSINSFSGFLRCHNVDLKVSGATESEREKILSLLMNGIYI